MPAIAFTCPATGRRVKVEPRQAEPVPEHYTAIECPACGLIHFVMPETGKVMAAPDD